MTDSNQKLLGKRIKQLRKQAGLTQEELAERVGIETGSLSGIESGRNFPSMLTVEKIANVLNIEMKVLFEFQMLKSINDMKNCIVKNIDKIDENQIPYIYKFFEGMK